MIFLKNDYGLGAHPRILKALEDANSSYFPGYGLDPVCEEAASLLRGRVECEEVDVHFLTGGTGLGLSIAKWIIDRHGGYFQVLSREGIGTRITVCFPS